MRIITSPLTKSEINDLKNAYGNYVKVTADLQNKILIVGIELHADAENVLLDKGGNLDDLWGGGVNLLTKKIDATAVYNIRPRLGNNNLEILDPKTRKKFIDLVSDIFVNING